MRQKQNIQRVRTTHRHSHTYVSRRRNTHSKKQDFDYRENAQNTTTFEAVDSISESRTKRQRSVDSIYESCSNNSSNSNSKMVTSNNESHSSCNYESLVNSKFDVSDFCVYDGNVVVVNWVLGKNQKTSDVEYAVKRGDTDPFVVCEHELSALTRDGNSTKPSPQTRIIENTQNNKMNSKREKKRVRQRKYRARKRDRLDEIFTMTESNFSPITDRESFSPLSFNDLEMDKFDESSSQADSENKTIAEVTEKPRLKFKISKTV